MVNDEQTIAMLPDDRCGQERASCRFKYTKKKGVSKEKLTVPQISPPSVIFFNEAAGRDSGDTK
jgi:hypothetical protein